VKAPALQQAAQTFMRPDQSLIVVVGDGAQIYDKLAAIAPTRIVNAQGDAMSVADLTPKTTTLPVDVSKLAERADSFSVVVQGNALGWQTSSLRKTPDGFVYSQESNIGGMITQSSQITFGADLAPRAFKATGKMQGQPLNADVTYANGRAKGTGTSVSPGGLKAITIDTTVAPGVLDDNMLAPLVAGLRWVPGAKYTVTVFDASSGATKTLTMAVSGTEDVKVPAGTFAAYKVDITGGEQNRTVYVTTAAPYHIVKETLVGTPLEFVLVK
jgi:hypothetical protein